MNLDQLRLFQRIVELGSLAAAARDIGLANTTVSERLVALEREMGTTLLNRSTRSISLTDAGRTLFEGLGPLLESADSLVGRVRHGAQRLSGPVRVSAPNDLGRQWAGSVIDRFQTQYPDVSVELHLSDGYVDIIGAGIDIALRYGNQPDRTLRARTLGTVQRIACASPAYLAEHGTPQSHEDLTNHRCLLMRFGQILDSQWHFDLAEDKRTIIVKGYRVSNDGHIVRHWCVEGHGIALKSSLDVRGDLAAGRLVPLFTEGQRSSYPLQMIFPPARAQPQRVKALADMLAKSAQADFH